MQIRVSNNRGMMPYGDGVEGLMGSRWTETADTAVRLVDLAVRLGRTESAVRQRASRLRALQLEEDVGVVDALR